MASRKKAEVKAGKTGAAAKTARETHPPAPMRQGSRREKAKTPEKNVSDLEMKAKHEKEKKETPTSSSSKDTMTDKSSDVTRKSKAIRANAPLPQKFLLELAEDIRKVVEPLARGLKGAAETEGTAQSGDVTFQLDKVAEKALFAFLRRSGLPLAYYSEDAGYSTFSSEKPKYLLIVDPVDGSRAARSGFEGCVVSIATTRVIERPTMADVDNACVAEILGNRVFYAERGKGVKIWADGHLRRPKLSENDNLDVLRWSMTVPGRPASLIFTTVYKLLEQSSLRGGFFACNSTAYSLTRLLTGQLDACVDVANRFLRDVPDMARPHFERAGNGRVVCMAPYDLAAALLIAEEAGCVVTDAYGNRFDDVLMLDSTETNQLSLVAAANRKLHEKLLEFLDRRIRQVESRLQAQG